MRQPTLNTIRMVESYLQKYCYEPIRITKLKENLPRGILHQTLKSTLDYLENSGKIIQGTKGIQWIYADTTQINNMLQGSLKI